MSLQIATQFAVALQLVLDPRNTEVNTRRALLGVESLELVAERVGIAPSEDHAGVAVHGVAALHVAAFASTRHRHTELRRPVRRNGVPAMSVEPAIGIAVAADQARG